MSGSSPQLSVVICTHNPQERYLRRVIAGLEAQTLPTSDWELILVDNASSPALVGRFDLSWHPAARNVHAQELGLTRARMRGIAEARGHILVFVDDDNVLSKTYLAEAISIAERYPYLGTWGAGTIIPEFESPPPEWFTPYLSYLAIRQLENKHWSNNVNDGLAAPVGAGLCVRKFIADRYREELAGDVLRADLGRRGALLGGADDFDLAFTSNRFELGWGTFPSLTILHLIPSARTTAEYLLRITESSAVSMVLLALKNGMVMPVRHGLLKRFIRGCLILARQGRVHLRFFLAHQRGTDRGYRCVARSANDRQPI